MSESAPEVVVAVTPAETPAPVESETPAPDVTVIDTGGNNNSDDMAMAVGALTERVAQLETQLADVAITADVAESVAEAAADIAVESVAVAEEAEEVAEETAEESEPEEEASDDPPGKKHWAHKSIGEWRHGS